VTSKNQNSIYAASSFVELIIVGLPKALDSERLPKRRK